MTSCNLVAHAGISRTRDNSSPTPAAAGPGADHPPPAAQPQPGATMVPGATVAPRAIVTSHSVERWAA
ncbi:hypothetical protein [Arthrobacter sp. H35-D1]|uniref:hypothetical protein n=1 Tax=Arthrobacter sp. H35-D1 TaxID=3046202 RepID=UPI0024BA2026|nr:hypothetical protein [Arthrobacter sp. H35-D1]MDJ0313027.1 hypothetical protein [Arthrobacter sp. H35-D1]